MAKVQYEINNNFRAFKLLGWKPQFSLEDGLWPTIEWYQKNHQIKGIVSPVILLEHT